MIAFNNNIKQVNNTILSNFELNEYEIIFEFTGKLYNKIEDNIDLLQIGNKLYMGPSGKEDDYIRHSCNPNCYLDIVGNRVFLTTLYVIKPQKEITIDYSLTLKDLDYVGECSCGFYGCRKKIKKFKDLEDSIKDKYRKLNIVPSFQEK